MKDFFSLRVTADVEGGLKTGHTCARFCRRLGVVNHQQASDGDTLGIATRYRFFVRIVLPVIPK